MPHYCFTLQVRPDRLEEYARRHASVWPDMLEALAASGWRDYRLFLRDDGLLVGTVEADDLDVAQAAMDATAVNARWQAEMAPFFADLPDGRPDTGAVRLACVFDLDAQHAGGPAGDDSSDTSGGTR